MRTETEAVGKVEARLEALESIGCRAVTPNMRGEVTQMRNALLSAETKLKEAETPEASSTVSRNARRRGRGLRRNTLHPPGKHSRRKVHQRRLNSSERSIRTFDKIHRLGRKSSRREHTGQGHMRNRRSRAQIRDSNRHKLQRQTGQTGRSDRHQTSKSRHS
ncbi:hypothetical protein ERJ75_001078300 [Trypanosoma vivax]|nr:hypothetical protein ERJ75_001078300 [Trypanosoma vivax]